MDRDPADALHDPARLAALQSTGLPDAPPEEAFDRLTRLAARLLRAPRATLSLVDDRRQFFLSAHGLPEALSCARGTPLPESLCAHVVASGAPLVIPDALADPAFRAHPQVEKHGLRSYAAVPVATPEGHVLGALCVSDTAPHAWEEGDVEALADLAALASAEVERRRSPRARLEAEGWFRSLVEQSIAAIYVYQDGVFKYVNPRCTEVFGYPLEEFSRPGFLARIVHPDDLSRVADNVRRRLAGEVQTMRYAFRGIRADGTLLYLEVHGTRAELDGKPALLGLGIDVTERVRAEEERARAVAARDRFYAMASHELRTPISTVMLYNDLLLSGVYDELSESQRDAVERSQKSAKHLLELINDLLDLSKLEAGKVEPRLEDVEVAELLEGLFADLAPRALEQGCTLSLTVESRPLSVTGDARRIQQILLNLLSNALKFGRGKPVEVRAGHASVEGPEGSDSEGGVVVEVTDHGPGIEPGELPRIFEDFVQLGDEGVGTGLGLPIARRLAELLGGRLEVSSVPGEGCTFRLFLPAMVPVGSGSGAGGGDASDVFIG
jgi:PAS domain S-box-containing protein